LYHKKGIGINYSGCGITIFPIKYPPNFDNFVKQHININLVLASIRPNETTQISIYCLNIFFFHFKIPDLKIKWQTFMEGNVVGTNNKYE